MSFKFLDTINELITEETLSAPSSEIIENSSSDQLPSPKEIDNLKNATNNILDKHRKDRLNKLKKAYKESKDTNLYQTAISHLPETIESAFSQIIDVIQNNSSAVPKGFTLAFRNENSEINNDDEIKKIWVRMYMLGLISPNSDTN